MMDGLAPLVAVQVRTNVGRADRLLICQKRIHRGQWIRVVFGGDGDFHPVARRQDNGFGDARPRPQVLQRCRQRGFRKGQRLPHFDRRSLVADSCQKQFHCRSSIIPRREWATQVTAEKPSTATVMMAAFRPRQPAVVLRNTSTRYVPHVKKEIAMSGWLIQAVLCSM